MKFHIWVGLPYNKFMEIKDAIRVSDNHNIRQLIVIGKDISVVVSSNDEGNPQISWQINEENE